MKALQSLILVVRQGGMWLLIGHLVTILGQFLFLKMIAVYGSNELFGQLAIVLVIFSGLQIILYGPVTQWAIRHYQEFRERKRLKEYYAVIQILSVALLAVSFFVAIFFVVFFDDAKVANNIGLSTKLVLLSVLFGVVACLNDLVSSIFNASSHSIKAAIFFAMGAWLRVFSLMIAIFLGQESLGQIVLWMIALQLLLLVLQCGLLIRMESSNIKEKLNKRNIIVHLFRMRDYALPFVIWGGPAYVALMGDRWVLALHVDASTLGVYAAMAVCTLGVANAMGVAMNKAIVPLVFRVSGSGRDIDRKKMAGKILNNLSKLLLVSYSPLILAYYFWPVEVISLFTSSEFTLYSEYLWILMLGSVAFNLSQFLITYGLVDKSPRIYVPIKYLHGLFAIVLLLILVPPYGVVGAVVAVVVSHILQLIFVMIVNRLVVTRGRIDATG